MSDRNPDKKKSSSRAAAAAPVDYRINLGILLNYTRRITISFAWLRNLADY